MKVHVLLSFGVLMLFARSAKAQQATAATSHDLDDAYQIYSLLLPFEEAYDFAKGTLVIQQDTVASQAVGKPCLTTEAAERFKDAIANFEEENRKPVLLQRQFQIDKPYELVSAEAINVYFKDDGGGWDGFYRRYPDSGGYIVLSAVGFGKDKTTAIVYTGSGCGGLCGRWGLHLLEKVGGKWKAVRGVTCVTVS